MRRSWLVLFCLLAVVAVALLPFTSEAPATSTYVSFSAYLSSVYYSSYNNTINVSAYARYNDSECSPSYQCDRTVQAEFTLRQGYGSYGKIMSSVTTETKYSSSMSVKFKVPSCRLIPKYKSQTYTVTMDAFAPNGDEKTATRSVYVRSCRR